MQLEEVAVGLLEGKGLFVSETHYVFGDGFGNNYVIGKNDQFPSGIRTLPGAAMSFLHVYGPWRLSTPKELLLEMGYVVDKHLDVPEWIKRMDTSINWDLLERHVDTALAKADKSFNLHQIQCFFADNAIEAVPEVVIDTCDHGHKFAKLPDHPRRHDMSRCPYCMSAGLDLAREQKEKQLKAILSFIEEGVDELTVRRIWERAMIEGNR